jgi:hypothetical protein
METVERAWKEISYMSQMEDPRINDLYEPTAIVRGGVLHAVIKDETPYKFEAYFKKDGTIWWLECPF